MPAKMDTEVNLRFLFVCFKHSNFSTIDYHGVAAHFEIKAPAARMRLMRLKQALELDMNMYPHSDAATKKRVRKNPWAKGKGGCKAESKEEAYDDEEVLDDIPLMERWRKIKREQGLIKDEDGNVAVKGEFGRVPVIKEENEDRWTKRETTGAKIKKEKLNAGKVKTEESEDGGVHVKNGQEERAQTSSLFSIPTNKETTMSEATHNDQTWQWGDSSKASFPTPTLSSNYPSVIELPANNFPPGTSTFHFSPQTPVVQNTRVDTATAYGTPYRNSNLHMPDASPYTPSTMKPETLLNTSFNHDSVQMTDAPSPAITSPVNDAGEDVQMIGAGSCYTAPPIESGSHVQVASAREDVEGDGGDGATDIGRASVVENDAHVTPVPVDGGDGAFFSPPELRLC